jgi:NADPH2:quinone reductase
MLAVRLHQTGGPEVLREEQIPVPDLRPGHALVKIDAVGVNFIEIYQRSGLYPVELPATLGGEGGGTVVAVAPDVEVVAVGARRRSLRDARHSLRRAGRRCRWFPDQNDGWW